MDNTPAIPSQDEAAARENALHDAASAVEALDDFSDADALAIKLIQAVPITLGDETKKALVRCLTGKQAIKLIRDAGKSGEKDLVSVQVMKLTRCLADPSDTKNPRFSDASALDVIEKGAAGSLAELLRAIHHVNPLIKNA